MSTTRKDGKCEDCLTRPDFRCMCPTRVWDDPADAATQRAESLQAQLDAALAAAKDFEKSDNATFEKLGRTQKDLESALAQLREAKSYLAASPLAKENSDLRAQLQEERERREKAEEQVRKLHDIGLIVGQRDQIDALRDALRVAMGALGNFADGCATADTMNEPPCGDCSYCEARAALSAARKVMP